MLYPEGDAGEQEHLLRELREDTAARAMGRWAWLPYLRQVAVLGTAKGRGAGTRMTVRTASFFGRTYKVRRVARALLGDEENGDCEDPRMPLRMPNLRVLDSLENRAELEVYIHEALHACYWFLDEEWIAQAGYDIARFLWRLGYRQENEKK